MIDTLHIKNIGIIDDMSVNLHEGFNVLTGETGAGKTLIIDSLQILAGGRFSKEMIRRGEKNSYVEASIYIKNEQGEEENIIVSREINIAGRNLCKINGRLVTVNELKDFMQNIIDIHGQNDNQTILDPKSHIEFLDDYIGNEITIIKAEYKKQYDMYLKVKSELKQNYGDDKEKQRKIDLLRYQLNEIDEADLKENEEDEVESKLRIINNSEKISSNLNEAYYELSDNILGSLSNVLKSIDKISNIDDKYLDLTSRIRSSYYELEESERDLDSFKDDIEYDEEEKQRLEQRLDLIQDLKRKYGNNILEILKYREKIEKELFDIENLDEYINKLKKDKENIEKCLFELSDKMNTLRRKVSKELSERINLELYDMEMKNAKFEVSILDEEKFNINGLNKVEFLIITNVGEEAKPLIKIASGGEMSRIMLGIKKVLSDVDKVPILIFDEIDTGISGVAAKRVGYKIREISKKHQVICVTHLATIVAKADYNYFISKSVDNDKTKTSIKLLDEDEVIKEIARISTGEVTEISMKHAKELRKDRVA